MVFGSLKLIVQTKSSINFDINLAHKIKFPKVFKAVPNSCPRHYIEHIWKTYFVNHVKIVTSDELWQV